MKKPLQILLIGVLFLMLVAVRAFVQPYFYDPLIEYFKSDYLHSAFPQLNLPLFFLNIFYRYALNAMISLAIIYLYFKNLNILKFSLQFYVIAFVLLSILLFILLKFNLGQGYMLIFYVRRFLIQPLFLLLLLPAFYYQRLIKKRNFKKRKL